jgi:hypothetical protein
MSDEKICFVIAPIGDPDSETRKRSDQVLKHVIRPAAKSCGYKAIRADEIDKPGLITSQVIQHVVTDELVVADLTERNPNVFYELAIRHAIRKPLVQIIRKGEPIPFDVAGTRTIYIDHKDLDSVEASKNEIVEQIRALEKDPIDIETPISVSLDLQLLRQSEKPEERSLADIMSALADLRASQSKMEALTGHLQAKTVEALENELKSLHSRMEHHLETNRGPSFRRLRMPPGMLREFLHFGPKEGSGASLLVIASLFRDPIPWVYDLCVELYRFANSGDLIGYRRLRSEFRGALDLATNSPLGWELFGRNKEAMALLDEIEPLLDRLQEDLRPRAVAMAPRRSVKAIPGGPESAPKKGLSG